MSMDFDLAIVGSGGGAFSAAIAARDRGLRVVMIERGVVGGTCVNVGCIPSKTLLAAADHRKKAGEQHFAGITTSAGPVDFAELVAAKDQLVGQMRQGKYIDLADEYGFEVVEGDATFVSGPALQVGDRRIEAKHFLIASGAEPVIPPIPGLAESGYLTSTTAMELAVLPESMIVIGGGPVAMEQAQLFADLGTQVTMIVRSVLARGEEPEVRAVISDAFRRQGITVLEGITVSHVESGDAGVSVAAGAARLTAASLLVATGRRPRTSALGLDAVGVDVGDEGELVVADDLRTTNPQIWGAGDVTGHPQYVYVAASHGAMMVDNAFGEAARRVDYSALPRITFTSPALASAGLTEAQALEQGFGCECRVLDLKHVPRALVTRNTHGVIKIVAESGTHKILGVHVAAEGAGDVILAAPLAVQTGMTVQQLATGWNPYLTLGEGLHLAAQSFTRDPSKLSCCAA